MIILDYPPEMKELLKDIRDRLVRLEEQSLKTQEYLNYGQYKQEYSDKAIENHDEKIVAYLESFLSRVGVRPLRRRDMDEPSKDEGFSILP